MPKFRKKPVVIDAMQIDPNMTAGDTGLDPNTESIARVSGWLLAHGLRGFRVRGDGPFGIVIETREGDMYASPGDWVIRGVSGEFYPCKPDIFVATYEPVQD